MSEDKARIIINHDVPTKRFNKWICFVMGIWRSMRHQAHVSGCDYMEIEADIPALVTVNRCEVCGDVEIMWTPLPDGWEKGDTIQRHS